MCRADLGDPDMQYRILHSASKRLQQGGPKRICVTTPPLVISATLLAQQYYQMKDQARIIQLLSLLILTRHSNALISLVLNTIFWICINTADGIFRLMGCYCML